MMGHKICCNVEKWIIILKLSLLPLSVWSTAAALCPTQMIVLKVPKLKIVELADSVYASEPPHLNLLCMPFSLRILNMIWLGCNIFYYKNKKKITLG